MIGGSDAGAYPRRQYGGQTVRQELPEARPRPPGVAWRASGRGAPGHYWYGDCTGTLKYLAPGVRAASEQGRLSHGAWNTGQVFLQCPPRALAPVGGECQAEAGAGGRNAPTLTGPMFQGMLRPATWWP